jgi:predicted trehalose synthase
MGILSKDAAKEETKLRAKIEQDRAAAEAAYWASPQGQARQARTDGRTWFQSILDVSETNQRTVWTMPIANYNATSVGKTQSTDQTGYIETIEAEGWRLEHVGYVFQEVSTISRDKAFGNGAASAVSGKIVGIYLFRADRSAPERATAEPDTTGGPWAVPPAPIE